MANFTISEFSHIIGASAKTLRYYEEMGILKPQRNEENNYRTYTDLDARRVMYCRYLRSLGFSMEEVCKIFNGSDLIQLQEKSLKKAESLQLEIDRLTSQKEMLDYYVEQIPLEQEDVGKCWIQETDADYYLLPKTMNDDLVINEKEEDLTRALWNLMPFGSMSVRISAQNLLDRSVPFSYEWGCGILKKYVTDPELREELEEAGTEYQTDCEAVTVLRHSEDGMCRNDFDFLLDYIDEQGYVLSDDVVGMLLLPEFTPEMTHYIKVFAPVQPRQ